MLNKLIKKLSNFRTTAIAASIVSLVAAIYALVSIFLYHFAGDPDPMSKGLVRIVGFQEKPFLGMALFFCALAVLIMSIFIVYSMFPFIMNKERLTPRKGLLVTGFASGVIEIALVIFMFLLAFDEVVPNTKIGIILISPIGILSAIGCGLYLFPFINCEFYMPEIVVKK